MCHLNDESERKSKNLMKAGIRLCNDATVRLMPFRGLSLLIFLCRLALLLLRISVAAFESTCCTTSSPCWNDLEGALLACAFVSVKGASTGLRSLGSVQGESWQIFTEWARSADFGVNYSSSVCCFWEKRSLNDSCNGSSMLASTSTYN